MPARKPTPIGQKFHYLTIIGDAPNGPGYQRRVVARCDCGSEKTFFLRNILLDKTQSCGCQTGELIHQAFRKIDRQQWTKAKDQAFTLIKGNAVLISASDMERVAERNWYLDSKGYVATNGRQINKKKQSRISLHRFILDAPKDREVDHIDGNPLNNRRDNLRLVTSSQNSMNSRNYRGRYKGAVYLKERGKWRASITKDSKTHYLGNFATEIAAAKAYDTAAKRLFGQHAKLNFPND